MNVVRQAGISDGFNFKPFNNRQYRYSKDCKRWYKEGYFKGIFYRLSINNEINRKNKDDKQK